MMASIMSHYNNYCINHDSKRFMISDTIARHSMAHFKGTGCVVNAHQCIQWKERAILNVSLPQDCVLLLV